MKKEGGFFGKSVDNTDLVLVKEHLGEEYTRYPAGHRVTLTDEAKTELIAVEGYTTTVTVDREGNSQEKIPAGTQFFLG